MSMFEQLTPQVHTYKVCHGNFHSVRTYMISRKTSVFTSHPRRKQCVLRQECVPLPMLWVGADLDKKSHLTRLGFEPGSPASQSAIIPLGHGGRSKYSLILNYELKPHNKDLILIAQRIFAKID